MITRDGLLEAIGSAVREAACTLRPDVRAAIEAAAASEPSERGRSVLARLLENACVALADSVPLCQDTGTARIHLTLGADQALCGDLQAIADEAVAAAYRDGALRMSTVRDALLDRSDPGDNTPAVLTVSLRPGVGAEVEVTLKGGGSDNASAVAMLPPSAGEEGVRRLVLETVEAKAAGACPPLIVGVGVGGTFDTVAALAGRALMRAVGSPPADARTARLEAALLAEVNATGIGPAGLGGRTTALAVHVVTAPCHIATLPVAVGLGCCAMRTALRELP